MTTRTAGSATKPSRQCPPLRTATRSVLPHRVLHGVHHLLGGADEAHVVGLAGESLVESPADEVGVTRVVRSDLVRTDPGALSLGRFLRPGVARQGRFAGGGGAIEQQLALARVAGERGRALELRARLVEAAELERAGRRARWAAGGSAWSDGSESSASTSSRPAAGPKAMATATARFSSTTGDGVSSDERVVERGDARPVRLRGRARPGVAGGDGGLQRVGARRAAQRLGARQRGQAAADQELVPAPAVLVEQQDRARPTARVRARAREAWISMSATRPWTSGSSGHELGQDAAQAQRVLAQRRAASSRRRRWRRSPR